MTDDAIPAFLRLTPEERAEAWRRNPPRAMPSFSTQRPDEDEATKQLRAAIEAADKQQTYLRLRKAGFVD
jgi:hypothetical protein